MARLLIGNSLRRYFDRWQFVRKALWLAEAAVFWLFLAIARVLPADRATAMGRRLMMFVGPRLDKHDKFIRNLELAFPEKTPAEIDSLAREMTRQVRARALTTREMIKRHVIIGFIESQACQHLPDLDFIHVPPKPLKLMLHASIPD